MFLIRGLIGLLSPIVMLIGIINVLAQMMDKGDTTHGWIMVVVGALMFIQAIPIGAKEAKEAHEESIKQKMRTLQTRRGS